MPKNSVLDLIALVVGYVVIGLGTAFAVYFVIAFVSELIISVENRFFTMIKVQASLIKYFKHRKKINEILKNISNT
jgi:hypothetical protein